jgi:drug/metabolite transporter (DMT)-like permease
MQPNADSAGSILTADTKVVLLGLTSAALTTAGIFFQKLNGVRMGNAFVSIWLLLAIVCFFPTFVIANKVFLMGGRMSLFVPATAAMYVLTMLIGRFYFGEAVSSARWLGCALIVAGVTAIGAAG